jgi:enolase
MAEEAVRGFVPAPTHKYRMQMDSRAVDTLRAYQARYAISDGESLILFHAFIQPALGEYQAAKKDLEHLAYLRKNLIRKRGSVQLEIHLREDDWTEVQRFFREMSDACRTLADDPMSTIQALLIREGEK